MNINQLIADLIRDEDLRLAVYDDKTGKPIEKGDTLQGHPTIGVGRLLTSARGISREEALYLLNNDLEWVFDELDRAMPWWRTMPEPAQQALANMNLNLGLPKLKKFRNMLTALQAGDYKKAADEALDSLWAKQVGDRSKRIAALYRSVG